MNISATLKENKAAFFKESADIRTTIGADIAKIRNSLGVSKRTLAKKAGICVKTLNKLEKGYYVRRYKTVSSSCYNALESIGRKINYEVFEVLTNF